MIVGMAKVNDSWRILYVICHLANFLQLLLKVHRIEHLTLSHNFHEWRDKTWVRCCFHSVEKTVGVLPRKIWHILVWLSQATISHDQAAKPRSRRCGDGGCEIASWVWGSLFGKKAEREQNGHNRHFWRGGWGVKRDSFGVSQRCGLLTSALSLCRWDVVRSFALWHLRRQQHRKHPSIFTSEQLDGEEFDVSGQLQHHQYRRVI